MSKGEFAAFYGSIGYQLSHIAVGQREHSYAIIPEAVYSDWKQLLDFDDEEVETVTSGESTYEQFTAHFTDTGHRWAVTTIKCPHPNELRDISWRLVLKIMRDDEIVSQSKMSAGDYWRYIKNNV